MELESRRRDLLFAGAAVTSPRSFRCMRSTRCFCFPPGPELQALAFHMNVLRIGRPREVRVSLWPASRGRLNFAPHRTTPSPLQARLPTPSTAAQRLRYFSCSPANMTASKIDGTAIAKAIRERLGAEIKRKQESNPRYKPALRIMQGRFSHMLGLWALNPG